MNIADHIYEPVKLGPDTVASEVLNFIGFLELMLSLAYRTPPAKASTPPAKASTPPAKASMPLS